MLALWDNIWLWHEYLANQTILKGALIVNSDGSHAELFHTKRTLFHLIQLLEFIQEKLVNFCVI